MQLDQFQVCSATRWTITVGSFQTPKLQEGTYVSCMHVSAPVGLKLLTQHCQSAAAGSLFPACSVRSARVTCRSCLTLQTGEFSNLADGKVVALQLPAAQSNSLSCTGFAWTVSRNTHTLHLASVTHTTAVHMPLNASCAVCQVRPSKGGLVTSPLLQAYWTAPAVKHSAHGVTAIQQAAPCFPLTGRTPRRAKVGGLGVQLTPCMVPDFSLHVCVLHISTFYTPAPQSHSSNGLM